MSVRSYIIDDQERKTFLLDREVLVSDEILRQEMSQVFGRCWIYVGHASELKNPGDFRSRKVAGRPVIFVRDQKGVIHCLFNTCRHRAPLSARSARAMRVVSCASITAGSMAMTAISPACRAMMPMLKTS